MPLAVDDDDGDLALTLGERVAGPEISTQRPHHLRQPGVVHPDLVRPAERATGLDQRTITLLLLRRHLIVRNFGVAAEGWCMGIWDFLLTSIGEIFCDGGPTCRPDTHIRSARRSSSSHTRRQMRTNIDIDDELMTKAGDGAITDRTLNPCHRVCPAPARINRRLPDLPAGSIPTY